MGMYASYYLIKQEDVDKAIVDLDSFDLDEHLESTEISLDLGKTWDALHCILTGKSTFESHDLQGNEKLLHHAIHGSQCLNEHLFTEDMDEDDYIEPIMYIDSKEVVDIANILANVDFSELVSNFDYNTFTDRDVYVFNQPIACDDELNDLKQYLIENGNALKDFYKKASQLHSAVHLYIG